MTDPKTPRLLLPSAHVSQSEAVARIRDGMITCEAFVVSMKKMPELMDVLTTYIGDVQSAFPRTNQHCATTLLASLSKSTPDLAERTVYNLIKHDIRGDDFAVLYAELCDSSSATFENVMIAFDSDVDVARNIKGHLAEKRENDADLIAITNHVHTNMQGDFDYNALADSNAAMNSYMRMVTRPDINAADVITPLAAKDGQFRQAFIDKLAVEDGVTPQGEEAAEAALEISKLITSRYTYVRDGFKDRYKEGEIVARTRASRLLYILGHENIRGTAVIAFDELMAATIKDGSKNPARDLRLAYVNSIHAASNSIGDGYRMLIACMRAGQSFDVLGALRREPARPQERVSGDAASGPGVG